MNTIRRSGMEIRDTYDYLHQEAFLKRSRMYGGVSGVFQNRMKELWHGLALEMLARFDLHSRVILEIGCGCGALSIKMAQRGARVIALDFSRQAVLISGRMSKSYSQPIDLVVASAEYIPLRMSSVDFVVSCETMEHVPRPSRMLEQINACLKVTGRAVLTIPNILNPRIVLNNIRNAQPIEHSLSMFTMLREIRKVMRPTKVRVGVRFKSTKTQRLSYRMPFLKAFATHIGFVVQKGFAEGRQLKKLAYNL